MSFTQKFSNSSINFISKVTKTDLKKLNLIQIRTIEILHILESLKILPQL